MRLTPCSDSLSLQLRASEPLTLPRTITRRLIFQEARRHMVAHAPTACRHAVSGLFHSPPGVLFTFPSRYCFAIGRQMCLALDRGRPGFIRNFTCSALLGCLSERLMYFIYGAFTLFGPLSQHGSIIYGLCNSLYRLQPILDRSLDPARTTPAGLACARFRLCPFRSPLLGVSLTISFPPGTEMFHFPGLPPYLRAHRLPCAGFPIQMSADHGTLAPPRGFSQLAASFFGIWRQGIPRVPFVP